MKRRRWVFRILILIFLGLIISRYEEVSKLAVTLSQGHWGWVAAAAALQLAFYVLHAALYEVAFSTVGVRSHIFELLPVLFASVFVNVALPTGGASGIALFVDDASRRGQSAARTAAGMILVLTADFSAFAVLLGLGLASLAVRGELHGYELAAAGILLGIILALSIALFLGLWKPWILLHTLMWIRTAVNRAGAWIKRPEILDQDWPAKNAMEFSAASAAIAAHPAKITRALIVSFVAHLINFASLYVLFLAFFRPIPLSALLAGYTIGNLFWIVSITPQGVGVVEGVMTLVFASLAVPIGIAAIIVLAYRGLGFWLPLLVGFLLIHYVRSFKELEHAHLDEQQ